MLMDKIQKMPYKSNKKMDKNNKNFKNAQQIFPPKNGQNSKMNEKSKKLLKIQKNLDF